MEFNKYRINERVIKDLKKRSSIGIVSISLIWGGFAKFMIHTGEAKAQFLMVMCSIGLCSEGVVAYMPANWENQYG
ncbi:MAG: hypothetical protein GY699_06885 [Desulfobacteraceae bacterium]|nr:hypothetical protein [Desulfobacteraceae bacterium]